MDGIAEIVPIVYKIVVSDRAFRVWPRSEACAFGVLAVALEAASSSPREWGRGTAPPLVPAAVDRMGVAYLIPRVKLFL